MRVIIQLLVAVMLAAPVVPTPAHAERELTDAPDPYVHRGTGIAFPEKLKGFRRATIIEHSGKGGDVTIDYWADETVPMLASILLIKGDGGSCADWFETVGTATLIEKGVTRDASAAPFAFLPDAAFQQFSATNTMRAGPAGAKHPDLVKPNLIACPIAKKGRAPAWVIHYSATLLAADASHAEDLGEQIFAAIDWTPMLGR